MRNIMKINRSFCLVLFSLFSIVAFGALDKKNIVINELLVTNTENLIDEYGNRSGWIELYNPTLRTIDIGGYYLTNDTLNASKYKIPVGDDLTLIPPLSHVIFFADNDSQNGIFHTNFTLNESNYIAIFDQDGITMIDAIFYPSDLPANSSYGRLIDGEKDWGVFVKVTPETNNSFVDKSQASKDFAETDPYGIVLAVASMSVVFLALLLLYALFSLTAKFSLYITKNRVRQTTKVEVIEEHTPGEVYASIAMALHEYQQEVHDVEDTILTIQRVAKTYSPWSSKIYGIIKTK
jgi:Na+-transporting methylmalonyl-CoA/oxaloacetate decarboxylase gamma subunit